MSSALSDAVVTALAVDGSPAIALEGGAALLFAELPSGARLALDAAGATYLLPEDGAEPIRFEPGTEGRFVEVLELGRRPFEDLVEAGARAAGLPPNDAVLAFPAMELLRAVLQISSGYTKRLALRFMLPSERAELRSLIAAVAIDGDQPQDVRDLAKHLSK